MKILIVEDDDALLSFLAKELEAREFEVLQTHFVDGGLHLYQKHAPWEFVLSDYCFVPGVNIKHGVQLRTAIHGINPLQRMAIMTPIPRNPEGSCPRLCETSQCCESHSSWGKCCGCSGSPCCRFDWQARSDDAGSGGIWRLGPQWSLCPKEPHDHTCADVIRSLPKSLIRRLILGLGRFWGFEVKSRGGATV